MLQRLADHVGVQVATFAGIDLNRRRTRSPYTLGIMAGLLITLNHTDRQPPLQTFNRCGQQRCFAGPRTGNQIQRQGPKLGKHPPILRRVGIVLAQNILLDPHHPLLRQARRVRMCRTFPEVQVLFVAVLMPLTSGVCMGVGMYVGTDMTMGMAVAMYGAIGMDRLMSMHVVVFSTGMIMSVAVHRTIGMVVFMRMGMLLVLMFVPAAVTMPVGMIMRMAVHRTIGMAMLMGMGMLMPMHRLTFDPCFTFTTTTYRTHKISLRNRSKPPRPIP